MTDQDQGREVAVERLRSARQRRDMQVRQYVAARGSAGERAAYTQLQAAVEQFAAREASLAWLDRGYEVAMPRKQENSPETRTTMRDEEAGRLRPNCGKRRVIAASG